MRGNGAVKPDEYRTHFSLWALLAASLIAGKDLPDMSVETREILTNREVIAVDQDKLGRGGKQVSVRGDQEVWAKPLDRGAVAVELFNRGVDEAQDLWAHTDLGAFTHGFDAKVPAHGVVMLRVEK